MEKGLERFTLKFEWDWHVHGACMASGASGTEWSALGRGSKALLIATPLLMF